MSKSQHWVYFNGQHIANQTASYPARACELVVKNLGLKIDPRELCAIDAAHSTYADEEVAKANSIARHNQFGKK